MLNEELYTRSQQGMFCTLCYLTLDLTNGKARCANAGHHPAICVSSEGIRLFGNASGPPAGILIEAPYVETEVSFKQGDTVLIKGSRSMHMEEIVRELMADPLAADRLLVDQH